MTLEEHFGENLAEDEHYGSEYEGGVKFHARFLDAGVEEQDGQTDRGQVVGDVGAEQGHEQHARLIGEQMLERDRPVAALAGLQIEAHAMEAIETGFCAAVQSGAEDHQAAARDPEGDLVPGEVGKHQGDPLMEMSAGLSAGPASRRSRSGFSWGGSGRRSEEHTSELQ